jgi:hypothetical protein
MKIAYFDCQFGAAGDMLLGALIGAGLPVEAWLAQLSGVALPKESYEIKIEDVIRSTIASKKVSVITLTAQDPDHERGLSEITEIIARSSISSQAKALANSIFYHLAEAEGSVHGIPTSQVHFHEVGALDSIIDIIGFTIAYELLGIESSIVSALPLGSGTVQTRHGLIPVPGPAVAALLAKSGAPIQGTDFKHECLTPTGAAILTSIAAGWGVHPSFDRLDAIGYGAGDLNPTGFPNVCRVLVGESCAVSHAPGRFRTESVAVIETNLDDLSPQILTFTTEQLLKLGALDVFVSACLMKKGRSGHLLTVLARPSDSDRLKEEILLQTSTLGVRQYLAERTIAEREWTTVQFDGGQDIRIKVARDLKGKIIHAQPEYEDCAAGALRSGLSLEHVFEQALAKFREGKAFLSKR